MLRNTCIWKACGYSPDRWSYFEDLSFMSESANCDTPNECGDDELSKIFENSQATFNENPSRWLGLVRDKLFNMFRSPMKEEYSHEAFRWVSQLCISIGDFSWVTTANKWTHDETKIFSCIARLSLSEIQILLPLMQRHLTLGDEPELEGGKIIDRSANHDDYDKLGTHLVIVESIIKSLVKDQVDNDDEDSAGDTQELNPVTDSMTPDELKNLLERLKETMISICEYLELVHRHWQDIIHIRDSEKFSSAQAAIRIISVWLSEDPGGFEPQCKRFLIDLMIKNLLLDDNRSRDDLTILALHSICAESDELVRSCKEVSAIDDALEKYLRYVQTEQGKSEDRRTQKIFKLRCGLVKDLANKIKETND